MPKVDARIKIKGKHYEILVDLDEALKVRNGGGDITFAIQSTHIYHDLKQGEKASNSDLQEAFNTTDVFEIAKKIITKGEVQKTQEYRVEEREKKVKQVINLLLRNAVDQNGNPYTEERLKSAIREAHFNFDNRPAEQQMPDLVNKLKEIYSVKSKGVFLLAEIVARFKKKGLRISEAPSVYRSRRGGVVKNARISIALKTGVDALILKWLMFMGKV